MADVRDSLPSVRYDPACDWVVVRQGVPGGCAVFNFRRDHFSPEHFAAMLTVCKCAQVDFDIRRDHGEAAHEMGVELFLAETMRELNRGHHGIFARLARFVGMSHG